MTVVKVVSGCVLVALALALQGCDNEFDEDCELSTSEGCAGECSGKKTTDAGVKSKEECEKKCVDSCNFYTFIQAHKICDKFSTTTCTLKERSDNAQTYKRSEGGAGGGSGSG